MRNGMVDASQDNMLKITNDGRKLCNGSEADQAKTSRMHEGSKVNACISNTIQDMGRKQREKISTARFLRLSRRRKTTAHSMCMMISGRNLLQRGYLQKRYAFIHEADSDAKKKVLFSKVRAGQVRILIGSTPEDWVPGPMCRKGSSHSMILTVRGDRRM